MIDLSEDLNDSYNQLILFVMVNSYWFYVLSVAKVTNEEFDYIKGCIKAMEEDDSFGELEQRVTNPGNPNGYSPTSFNRCKHIPSRYPDFIQDWFSDVPVEMYMRPWYLDLTTTGKDIVIRNVVPEKTKEQVEKEGRDRLRKKCGTALDFA